MSAPRSLLLCCTTFALALSGCDLIGGFGAAPDGGDDGGVTEEDGGVADGGGLPVDCQGTPFTGDGRLDVDLKLVRVSGRVTMNGAPLPSETSSRGTLLLTHQRSRSTATVPLQANGAVQYALTLAPGRYDVVFAANPAGCLSTVPSAVPCTGGTLLTDVDLTTDQALDVDLPAVTVSGQVTLNGATLPSQGSARGQLVFQRQGGTAAASRSLGGTGPGTYQMVLLRGDYTVRYRPEGTCNGSAAPPMPCVEGTVATASLNATGTLDVNVPAVSVTGVVTAQGGPLPSTSGSRGALTFGLEAGGTTTVALGTSGPVTYVLTLLPGTYAVGFSGNASLCTGTAAPPMPCNTGPLTTASLTASGTFDVNVPLVRVSGAVTVDGAPLPSTSGSRGRLAFTLVPGAVPTSVPLGTSGALQYLVSLLPGTYQVSLVANPQLCNGLAVPPMPCNSGLLTTAALTADGPLNVDLPTVAMSGQVTLAGHALPAVGGGRGSLLFTRDLTPAATVELGSSGGGTYGVRLLAGPTTVTYQPAGSCDGQVAPPMPCNRGALLTTTLSASGALDVDVPVVHVTGGVTLQGAPLPTTTGSRGQLSFVRTDGSAAATLGTSGPVSYVLSLLPGSYVVRHDANPGLCDGRALGNFPCSGQLLAGCAAP